MNTFKVMLANLFLVLLCVSNTSYADERTDAMQAFAKKTKYLQFEKSHRKRGPRGHHGHRGHRGFRGHHGHRGIAGAVGAAGAVGSAGSSGSAGSVGATGPTGVAELSAYAAVFTKNTAITLSPVLPVANPNTLIFDTVSVVHGISYNNTTGVFTVTQTGDYSITYGAAMITVPLSLAGALAIQVNGSTSDGSQLNTLTADQMNSISTIIHLTAGDTFEVVNISAAYSSSDFLLVREV